MKEYIAFDIGGTQIKYGIVSEIGRVLKRKTVATEIHLGGEQIIQKLIYVSKKIMNEHTIAGIGISTTGIVDINKGIMTGGADHIPGYSTIPIIDRLQEILKVPVSIDNDVNCAAFGEKWNGSGREKENFIMLTLGTGIGGAIFIDGELYRGHSFSAGEWGNMLIEGKTFEEVASISGLIRLVRKYKGKGEWNGKRIFELYDKGDREVAQAVGIFFKHLAIGISNLAYIFNPETIIIGGGITDRGNEFLKEVKEEVSKYLNQEIYNNCEIELAQNGNCAGMIGAIYHFLHHHK
ncbi:sugar kinase [Bacillus thuringiensis serovar kyushuensis]|uniref:ROK family protein n=2 Tax=Bacillus thuringiensis TaxID=1428 RepID=A0A9X7BYG1_BACTU|nr:MULTISPECIES: ROK family protein [Bacillus cereus group]ALC54816.1 ROK family transcriptional regulator [Bacillus cereus]AOM09035.1 transcriptional regulator/sugar kinase [Bacillus thuringiensis Bt18247]MBG9528001.1 ROK family transcriptional regulator [Bacillus thuringiensis]MEC2864589.1 ROK family protein [Bacillus cereus]OJE27904.1 sugar kinase [Bacillus thuringiensis]